MTSAAATRWMAVVVFVVGASSLGAEIAATRLLAPWFGTSTIVWANTIATVLLALSIGYAVGGRIADKHPTLDGMSRVVLVSAVLIAIVPFASGPFLRSTIGAFENLSAGTFVGSLVAVGVLIAVPVLLLGMVSPWAVRLRMDHLEDAGRIAGRLYAIGTVGSLTGTFASSLLLIPLVGSRRTFLIYALALALVALPGLVRGKLVAGLVAAVIVGLITLPVGTTKKASADGYRVIWEKETEYQYARVLENDEGRRQLELNEGQAVHSVYTPGDYLNGGYWDQIAMLPWAGANPPQRVVNLGSAAGSTARTIGHYFPDVEFDAVEIDEEITEVGEELFEMGGPNLRTHTADARPWLHKTDETFDAIMIDAYRQPYIPFYLTTREFFELVRDRLNEGGVAVVNVGHAPQSDALEETLTATMRAAFGADRVWRNPATETNTVLLATTSDADPATQLREADVPEEIRSLVDQSAAALEPGLNGGTVYTDDKAPVEWLIDTSLAEVATDADD